MDPSAPKRPRAAAWPRPALGADEGDLDGELEQEPGGEHLPEDLPQRVARHVAARVLDEVADGGMVADRQSRWVIASDAAEPPRDSRALVEDRDQASIDARQLVAQLVCLTQGCAGHHQET